MSPAECVAQYPDDELEEEEYWLATRREGCLPLGWYSTPDWRCTPQSCSVFPGAIGLPLQITTNSSVNGPTMLVNVSFDQVQSSVPPDFPQSGAMLGVRIRCAAPSGAGCNVVGGDLETRSIYDWQDDTKAAQVSVPAGEGTGIDDQATRLIQVDITTTWPDYYPDDPAFQPRTDTYDDIPIRCDHGNYAGASRCSHHTVTPILTFDASADSLHREAAAHIWDAQHVPESTYPGHPGLVIPGAPDSGRPLTRNWHAPELVTQSRTLARAGCTAGFPDEYPAEGIQCDEYPFARTYQNAATVAEGSDRSYSVRPINGNHNASAGGRLGALYASWFLLDNDPFWVDVVGE